jgi:hypothetical protein
MGANDYHFVTRWRVEGTCGEVADVIGAPLDLPRWWPAVYLAVEQLAPLDEWGLGGRVRLVTKGWLPYTLTWEFVVTESTYPNRLAIDVIGDFVGRGAWTFAQDGAFVDVTFDWLVAAEKPLLRLLSGPLRPVFEANHRWAMAQGEESLELELARRRAAVPGLGESDPARAIPPPPGPITYAGVAVLGGAALIGAATVWTLVRIAKRIRRWIRRRKRS